MIPDKEFKALSHSYRDYKILNNGGEIEKGYKPDYVLYRENKYVILESECSTSRKMYIGCMMKAAYFLQGNNSGILVIILSERDNTTLDNIADHLKPYYEWIKGNTNLENVYVIRDCDYKDCGYRIDSPAFNSKSKKI